MGRTMKVWGVVAVAFAAACSGDDSSSPVVPTTGAGTEPPATTAPAAATTIVPTTSAAETTTTVPATTATASTTAVPAPTTTAPDDECGDDVVDAVRAAHLDIGVPEGALDAASFEEVTCSGDHASVRIEGLSDPGYRSVLERSDDGWRALEPLAVGCLDGAAMGVPAEDWAVLVRSAALDSERGWVPCETEAETATGTVGLVAAPDGLGAVGFAATAEETLAVIEPAAGPPTDDLVVATSCGEQRVVAFGTQPGLLVRFGVDNDGSTRFGAYELGTQGADPVEGPPEPPAWLAAIDTPEGVGYGSPMDQAAAAYPDMTSLGNVVQSFDSRWDTGTGLVLRTSDDTVVLIAAGDPETCAS